MRLPQSILRYLSVRTVHFLTIGVVITLLGMLPGSAAAATPQLTCTPAGLRFGAVVVGHTETMLVTVTNNGETSVTVSGMAVSSSVFTTSSLSLPLVLPAGQSFNLSVSYTPTAAVMTGTNKISFSSDASNPTLVLEVGGRGVSIEVLSVTPSIVGFGRVETGTSSTLPVVLKNDRFRKVDLSALQVTGRGFSISGPTFPLTLSLGQSVTVNVTFTPESGGTVGGSVFVPSTVMSIPLTGTGTVTPYSVNLFWNSSSDVVGYNVYRSTTASGTYSKINPSLDSNTAYTDGTVVSGHTYYYAATAVNSSGQESARSTPPVKATVP
jgi:ASPM-SPD-2-Hydin domain-containing protein